MKHKQHTEKPKGGSFLVEAMPAGPEPNDERLFVVAEFERIEAIMDNLNSPNWWRRITRAAAAPTLKTYEHYGHQLETYARVIDRYDQDMEDGVWPFRVLITNISHEPRHNIQIVLSVAGGAFLLTRPLPMRPARPDGVATHTTEVPTYDLVAAALPPALAPATFRRTDVLMSDAQLSAQFSTLQPKEQAAVINQTLFVTLAPATEIAYQIKADGQPTQIGFVEI
jgi:hypothetical protein